MYSIDVVSDDRLPLLYYRTLEKALAAARARSGSEPVAEPDGSWWAEGALVDRGPELSLGRRSSVRVRPCP